MNELKIFLLGFLFIYIVQIFDIILNLINSYSSILVTRCQVKINELSGEEKVDDGNRIGFHVQEDIYYEEDEE